MFVIIHFFQCNCNDVTYFSAIMFPFEYIATNLWSWPEMLYQQLDRFQLALPPVFQVAKESFSFWTMAFYPKKYSQKDCKQNNKIFVKLHFYMLYLLFCLKYIIIPKIVKIANLFHAEPTKLRTTNCTRHVIAASIIHFDDQNLTSGTWFYVIS